MKTVAIVLTLLLVSLSASAHRNGKVHRHGRTIVVNPVHHHHPVASLAAVVGLAVVIDAAGNAKTESGKHVVVLESKNISNGLSEIIEKDNVVYILQ